MFYNIVLMNDRVVNEKCLSSPHFDLDTEGAIGTFQFKGAVEIVAFPGQGRGGHAAIAVGIVLALGAEAPAVVQLELGGVEVALRRAPGGPQG